MSINTLDFVCSVMQRFAEEQITTWLFGGWAEELWQMSPPRSHRDIDLLYPAQNFQQLDRWIATTSLDLFPDVPPFLMYTMTHSLRNTSGSY